MEFFVKCNPQGLILEGLFSFRSFTADPQIVQNLKDMGITEDDITQALKAVGNNQEAACAWLLGEREEEEEVCRDSLQVLKRLGCCGRKFNSLCAYQSCNSIWFGQSKSSARFLII